MEVEGWKKHHRASEAAERLIVQDGGGCSRKGEGKHELKIWWKNPKAANEAWSSPGTGTDKSSLNSEWCKLTSKNYIRKKYIFKGNGKENNYKGNYSVIKQTGRDWETKMKKEAGRW